jgi:hypothetical protein
MRTPIPTIFIHHSVTRPSTNPARDFRDIEAIGRARFGRFSYSWVVHPNGTAGEGAGLTVGAHTGGHNSTSLGICFIGNYEQDRPTAASLNTAADIIRYLQVAGIVPREVVIRPHRDVKSTACPGRHLVAALPTLRDLVARPLPGPTPAPRPTPPPGTDLTRISQALDEASKQTLRVGSRGDAVKWAQALVNQKVPSAKLAVDGVYGPSTAAAVRQFQENVQRFFRLSPKQFPADGVVGPSTWKMLRG